MKDNQINTILVKPFNHVMYKPDVITKRVSIKPQKKIPVEVWTDFSEYTWEHLNLASMNYVYQIRNSGGRTYLVSRQNDGKGSL